MIRITNWTPPSTTVSTTPNGDADVDETEAIKALIDGGLLESAPTVRCENCRYSRRQTGGMFDARGSALSHALKKSHCVHIRDNGVIVRTYDYTNAPNLFYPEEPPF